MKITLTRKLRHLTAVIRPASAYLAAGRYINLQNIRYSVQLSLMNKRSALTTSTTSLAS